MSSYPKLEPSSFSDDKASQSFLTHPKLIIFLPRRIRRISFVITFPLALLLFYLLPSLLNTDSFFLPSAPYASQAGKSALKTTIDLPKLQFPFPKGSGSDLYRLRVIKEAIQRTWELYGREAWGWDEVCPIKGGGRDTRSSRTQLKLIPEMDGEQQL